MPTGTYREYQNHRSNYHSSDPTNKPTSADTTYIHYTTAAPRHV